MTLIGLIFTDRDSKIQSCVSSTDTVCNSSLEFLKFMSEVSVPDPCKSVANKLPQAASLNQLLTFEKFVLTRKAASAAKT